MKRSVLGNRRSAPCASASVRYRVALEHSAYTQVPRPALSRRIAGHAEVTVFGNSLWLPWPAS